MERYTVNTFPTNYVMLSNINDKNILFLIYDKQKEKSVGYISFNYYNEIESYTVGGAFSKGGVGVFLYESAMTYVYPNGLSMSRDSLTSSEALDVWKKFIKRSDVESQRINSYEITHKAEDLKSGGMYDDNPQELENILRLEDTRFYHNYNKAKLRKLLNEGRKFMDKNGITGKQVEYMSWDLEI